MLAWVLPNLLLSPVAGVLADRWDRRLVMIFADTGAALSSLFIIVMLFTGELQVWHVYVSGFFNAAFSTFQWPAYSAATAQLVPKHHLGRAGGMTQIGDAISQLAGPAIAGALFVTAGLKAVLAIDVASYLAALATLLSVRFPRPTRISSSDDVKVRSLEACLWLVCHPADAQPFRAPYGGLRDGKLPGQHHLRPVYAAHSRNYYRR